MMNLKSCICMYMYVHVHTQAQTFTFKTALCALLLICTKWVQFKGYNCFSEEYHHFRYNLTAPPPPPKGLPVAKLNLFKSYCVISQLPVYTKLRYC